MFTVVTAKQGGFWRRPKPNCIRKNGVCFYLLQVNPHQVKRRCFIRLLDGSQGRVLYGEGISPPIGATPLKTPVFWRYALYAGLSVLLQDVSLSKQMALLLDWDGRFQSFARLLLAHFSRLHVLTAREEYCAFAERAFRLEGATVTFSRELRGQPFWVVAPDGFLPEEVLALDCPVFTPEPAAVSLNCGASTFVFPLADSLRELLPPGVSPELFQAAAYEFCGFRGLDVKSLQAVLINGEKVPLQKAKSTFLT